MYRSKKKIQYQVSDARENIRPTGGQSTQKTKLSSQIITSPKASLAVISSPSKWYEEKSTFKLLVSKCGMKLSVSENTMNLLSVHSTKFVKLMNKEFDEGDGRLQNKIDDFIDGFKHYINQKHCLQIAVRPTLMVTEDFTEDHNVLEDSVTRLLMKVDILQPRIACIVIEKLQKLITMSGVESEGIAQLIVNQFRYLEFVVDSHALLEKFFELIQQSKLGSIIQIELLECLPELSNDVLDESLCQKLKTLLEDNQIIVLPVIQTIAKLNLPQDFLNDIRNLVLSSINDYNLSDVPLVIRFLLETASSASKVTETYNDLSRLLHLDRIFSKQEEAMKCVEILHVFLKYRQDVTEGVLKFFEKLPKNYEINILDLICLIILSKSAKKKTATGLLRQFVRGSNLTYDLFENLAKK